MVGLSNTYNFRYYFKEMEVSFLAASESSLRVTICGMYVRFLSSCEILTFIICIVFGMVCLSNQYNSDVRFKKMAVSYLILFVILEIYMKLQNFGI